MFLSDLDMVALVVSVGVWVAYSVVAQFPRYHQHSLGHVTAHFRLIWMRHLCNSSMRMTDSALMGNLMRSVAFFASASILVLSGLVALIGSGDKAFEVFQTLPFHDQQGSLAQFETKAVLLVCIFIYAFFQITWSLRQFNYTCILIGAAPTPDASDATKDHFAEHAAHIGTLASESFNMGLRAYYFALAMLAWFISSWLFMLASVLVVLITYRREFKSHSLATLTKLMDGAR